MSLEKKKKQLELGRVKLAKEEMELRIEERMEDIKRLKTNIEVQNEAIERLEKELETM